MRCDCYGSRRQMAYSDTGTTVVCSHHSHLERQRLNTLTIGLKWLPVLLRATVDSADTKRFFLH